MPILGREPGWMSHRPAATPPPSSAKAESERAAMNLVWGFLIIAVVPWRWR